MVFGSNRHIFGETEKTEWDRRNSEEIVAEFFPKQMKTIKPKNQENLESFKEDK